MKKILYTLLGMMLSVGAWAQTSLQEQINSATEATTIQLSGNVDLGATTLIIPADKNITIDLNGHNITSSASGAVAVKNNGTLTVEDTSGEQAGKIISTKYAGIGAGDNSVTTFESGNIESVEGAIITGKVVGATITINGGTLSASDNAVVMGNGSKREGDANTIAINGGTFNGQIKSAGYVACGIYAPWKDVITVNGGTFNITGGCGVLARAGSVTINGGVFNCSGTVTGKVGDSRVVVPCSAVVFDSQAGYPAMTAESKIEVPTESTAKFTAAEGVAAVSVVKNDGADSHIEISGGTYSSPLTEDVCAEGYIPSNTQNADGTYGAKPITYVAQVGENKYESLTEAIAAAADGGIITLLADVTDNITIPADKSITLDLNGKTLSGGSVATNGKKAAIVNNGTLIIQDSSAEQTGTIKREDDDIGLSASNSYYVIDNQGVMAIKSGNVINNAGLTSTHKGSSLIRVGEVRHGTVLNIEGGTLTQNNFDVIKIGGDATLNISGGTINSSNSYAVLSYGNMNMTAGTINGNVCLRSYTDDTEDSHGVGNISGGTVNGNITVETYTGNTPNTLSECNISGTAVINGTLSVGEGNGNTFTANDEKGTIAVSGGTFSSAVPEEYCAEGFVPVPNADGTYEVVEGELVAEVGGKKYASLAAAVAAAEAGATVTLLEDITLTARVEPNKDMTIDLNGHTIKSTATCGNGSAFDVKGGAVTIKNGTIDGTAVTETECDAITARSGANVTLEDLNITVNSMNGACAYAFDGSKITIESGNYENKTTETYQYNSSITGMVVNQANNVSQLIFIKGGTFKGYDPAMGDDSQLANENFTFLAPGFYTEKNADGAYVLVDEYTVTDGVPFKTIAKPATVATATYSRTMPSGTKWGTVCVPFTLKSGTIKLYTFGSIEGFTLNVTEVDEVAPGTPVIFYCEASEATFTTENGKVKTSALGEQTGNLVGTYEEQNITQGLSSIYFINGDKFHQAKASLTVPAYRAYIQNTSAGAKAAVLNIVVDGEATAIEGVAADLNDTQAIYDVNGRQLSAPQKGINIMKLANGKTVKLIIK